MAGQTSERRVFVWSLSQLAVYSALCGGEIYVMWPSSSHTLYRTVRLKGARFEDLLFPGNRGTLSKVLATIPKGLELPSVFTRGVIWHRHPTSDC